MTTRYIESDEGRTRIIVDMGADPQEGQVCHDYCLDRGDCKEFPKGEFGRIKFQNGTISEDEDGNPVGVNGCTMEDLLAVVADRLTNFQAGEFGCSENADALECIEEALESLARRTERRKEAGVEGTSVATPEEGETPEPPAAPPEGEPDPSTEVILAEKVDDFVWKVSQLADLAEIQREPGNSGDEYGRGMANGMSFSLGVLTGEEPVYLDAPVIEDPKPVNPDGSEGSNVPVDPPAATETTDPAPTTPPADAGAAGEETPDPAPAESEQPESD